MKPTAISLFAGVGGIDLALERAGYHVTAAVELDNAARGVLADRLPDTTLFPDVTEVSADDLRATGFVPHRGLVAAGWPCQGNSVAGRRGGLADPRSGLWRHVVRLLAELNPRWFLGENVPGLLSVTEGEDFGIVVQQLADLGYGFSWRILDAQHFGVPQRRRRVFIVGRAGGIGAAPAQVLLEPEGGERDSAAGEEARTRPARRAAASPSASGVPSTVSTLQGGGGRGYRIDAEAAAGGHLVPVVHPLALRGRDEGAQLEVGPAGGPYNALRAGDGGSSRQSLVAIRTAQQQGANGHGMAEDVAHTLDQSNGQAIAFSHTAGIDIQASEQVSPTIKAGHDTMPSISDETTVRRLTPVECERLQGFPDGWTATSHGRPQADSARYRQMGNAVAVPCVEWITRRIAAMDGAS